MTASAVRPRGRHSARQKGYFGPPPTFADPSNEAVHKARFEELHRPTTLAQRQMADDISVKAVKVCRAVTNGTAATRAEAVRLLGEIRAMTVLLEGELS